MELPGKRKRGRPKRRFMDVVKEDMAEVEVTEEDIQLIETVLRLLLLLYLLIFHRIVLLPVNPTERSALTSVYHFKSAI